MQPGDLVTFDPNIRGSLARILDKYKKDLDSPYTKIDDDFSVMEVISIKICCGTIDDLAMCDRVFLYVPVKGFYIRLDFGEIVCLNPAT